MSGLAPAGRAYFEGVTGRALLEVMGLSGVPDAKPGAGGLVKGHPIPAGLFTVTAYTSSARTIPLLRRKVADVLARAGFAPESHSGRALVKVLESYLAPTDFTIGELAVRKGTWLLAVRVLSDELWERVKTGDLTGFSIGGSARRVPEPAPVPTSEQPTNNQPASEAAV